MGVNDALATVKFAILNALAGRGVSLPEGMLVFSAAVPRQAGKGVVDAIVEELFSPPLRWAVREYLDYLESEGEGVGG